MTLPFQACECYMANITPLQGRFIKLMVELEMLRETELHELYLMVTTYFDINKFVQTRW